MKSKLEKLVGMFDLDISKSSKLTNELIAELTQLIREMYGKSYIHVDLLKKNDVVYVINMVNEKLYYMDILYGSEMLGAAIMANTTYYNNSTVLCIHVESRSLISFA